MSTLLPHARFTRWIAVGLAASFLLLALRVGYPIYRRKQAIDRLRQLGTVITTDFWNKKSDEPARLAFWKKAVPESWLPAFEDVVSIRIAHRDVYRLGLRGPIWRPHDTQSRGQVRELLATIRQFRELQWLDLDGEPLDDEDLRELADLKNLECIVLANTRLRGAGLRYLSGLPRCKSLDLSHTEIDDAAFEILGELASLELLRIDGTRVGDTGLKHLAKLSNLRELSCSQTPVTESGLQELLKTHPDLSVVDD